MALYSLFMPVQAVGANLVYFDLFNASGSSKDLEIITLQPVVSGSVAVTGTLGIDLFLTRTTAVGTGGTAATAEGTSLTAPEIVCIDGSQPIHSSITARLTPTGGATAGAVITWSSVFAEETSPAAYIPNPNMARLMPDMPGVLVKQGTGIRVVQGAVASAGNVGFNIAFKVTDK